MGQSPPSASGSEWQAPPAALVNLMRRSRPPLAARWAGVAPPGAEALNPLFTTRDHRVGSIGHAPIPSNLIGEKGIIKPYTIGCHSEKEYDKLSNLLDLGDKEASKNFMVSRVRLGVCRTIMEGGEAVVEKVTFSSNKICVRKAGDIDCLWVDRLLVQKKNNASLL